MKQIKDPEQVIGKVIKSINFHEDFCAIKFEDNNFIILSIDTYDNDSGNIVFSYDDFEIDPEGHNSYELFELGFITREQHLIAVENRKKIREKAIKQQELSQYLRLKIKYESSK